MDYYCGDCHETFEACQCPGGPICYDCEPTGEDCHCYADDADDDREMWFLQIGWWSPAGFSLNPAHYPDGVVRAYGPAGEQAILQDSHWLVFDAEGNPMTKTTDLDALKAANQQFYDAFGALDLAAMDDICLDSDQALCVHPGWQPLVGWEIIRESWRRIFDNTTLMHFNIRYINVVVEGDCGWVTCVENITSVLQGRADNFGVLATNIFIRAGAGWRLIAHHASPGM